MLYLCSMEQSHLSECDRHTFDFKECYDEGQLAGYGITVEHDSLGNTGFRYRGIEIGYLLDIIGEPFMFAMSYRLGMDRCAWLRPEDRFCAGRVIPKYGKGMSYWCENLDNPQYLHLPRKFHEPALNWYNTGLTPGEFREELTRRLLRASRLYDRKERELGLKFEILKKRQLRSRTDEECIENLVCDEIRRGDPVIYLPNGTVLVMFYAKKIAFASTQDHKRVYVLNTDPVDYELVVVEKFDDFELWMLEAAAKGVVDAPAK